MKINVGTLDVGRGNGDKSNGKKNEKKIGSRGEVGGKEGKTKWGSRENKALGRQRRREMKKLPELSAVAFRSIWGAKKSILTAAKPFRFPEVKLEEYSFYYL